MNEKEFSVGVSETVLDGFGEFEVLSVEVVGFNQIPLSVDS